MTSIPPFWNKPPAETLHRNGFTESRSESMLRDWILLAAAFTGAQVALVLKDETGIWYADSSGLSAGQLEVLGSALSRDLPPDPEGCLLEGLGLYLLEALPLVDDYQRAIGTLGVLSPAPLLLAAGQREGLRRLANQIQAVLAGDRQQMETRAAPRAPWATSFVPGLVHELGSFIFGISANLDAFEARFAALEDVSKYGATIRKSLDRMSTFIEELREYGDPHRFSWSERELEPLLREAIEHHAPAAARNRIALHLHTERPLPPLLMDEQSLRSTFIRLIDLLLQQEKEGGQVTLHAATYVQEGRAFISGHLDGASSQLKDVDPARLFEPFYFRAAGMGRLALPGARRIFDSHGGNLMAGPGPEGGLRIRFMLPALVADPSRSAGPA